MAGFAENYLEEKKRRHEKNMHLHATIEFLI